MRNIFLSILVMLLQNFCFSQSSIMDSLKTELNNAKEDTTKLKIYLALGEACERKDILLYTEPAQKLVDNFFLTQHTEKQRKKLLEQELALLYGEIAYYTSNNITDWSKVMAYTDTRIKIMENTGDRKRIAEFLFQVAGISLDSKKDSAMFRTTMQKSLVIFNDLKDSVRIVDGYHFLFNFYRSAGNFTESFESIQSAISISRKLNYSKGIARSLWMLADLYRDYGEYDQALENYQAAQDILNKTKDTSELFNVLAAEAGFYHIQHNTGKALEYYNKLIEICASYSNPDHNAGSAYKWIGMVYSDNNDYNNALLNFEKSLHLFDSSRNIFEAVRVLNEIGLLYNKKGDFEKAIRYHARTVSIADSLKWDNLKPELLHFLAKDYYGLKNYSKAKEINDTALVNFKKYWFDIKITSQMELLATQIDSARGDGMGAYVHYKVYVSLMEKIKGEEIRKEAQKEKFQNESARQKSEQEKKDTIAKRTRNLQYIVIAAILLLGIFLLYGYIQKNRSKKRIEKAYVELKHTQAQLIQSEKMASLGELTAGIAHEIQNPLNFVNNFSEVNTELIDEAGEEINKGNIDEAKNILHDIKENEQKINHHGKRADAIVKGMLQHSRSSSGVKEPTDINALCDEYLRLSYHGLRAKDKSFNATIKTDLDKSIEKINIIPQDIGRVILNLLTNAFYAVNEKALSAVSTPTAAKYEPTVSISTKKIDGKILISVSDNGNGIPQKVLDKIFQPFFTTKPTGQGTGLGLSLSYDIITKAHGGELKVETNEGMGTTFIIILFLK